MLSFFGESRQTAPQAGYRAGYREVGSMSFLSRNWIDSHSERAVKKAILVLCFLLVFMCVYVGSSWGGEKPFQKKSAVGKKSQAHPEAALQIRPERVDPGGLFEFLISGKLPAKADEAELVLGGKDTFKAFKTGDGRWKGYGAVRASEEGKSSIEVSVLLKVGGKPLPAKFQLREISLTDRSFPSRRLSVAKKFTHPSKAQKKRVKADQEAFSRAYKARESSKQPVFSENFIICA